MATLYDLEEEIKELLLNYKQKKATTYEPCTQNNIKECLIGIHEELDLLNINYIFNPYLDLEQNTLTTEALVKLVNAFWTLIHFYKNLDEKTEKMKEQHHLLESNNNELKDSIAILKGKLNMEKNEARACVVSAQRLSDQSEQVLSSLSEAQAKLNKITKQKQTMEKGLKHEINRLKSENESLLDKLRIKTYTPCTDVCDSSIVLLKERDRKQRHIIAKLQETNQSLLSELLSLKEDIILGGLGETKN